MKLEKNIARQLVLYAQGLHHLYALPNPLEVIRRLGYVQIDSISVVQRAHHHTFWVRYPAYQAKDLAMLQKEPQRGIFEYWSHAAAYLPIEDFRYCLPRMRLYAGGKKHWFEQQPAVMQYVLDRIKAEGPLKSKDFKKPDGHQSGAWWNWKPTKIALEQLFHAGQLMVLGRDKFQKVYDLPENVLPNNIDTRFPTEEEQAHYLIDRTIQAQGLATLNCICYLRNGGKKLVKKTLEKGLQSGRYISIKVEGFPRLEWYTTSELIAQTPKVPNQSLHIVCPFDNLIIQRERMRRLFDFHYHLECYVPAAKRKIGYYTLPILYQDRFVAQIDLKADRKKQQLFVKNMVVQEGKAREAEWWGAFEVKLEALRLFNACEEVIFPANL